MTQLARYLSKFFVAFALLTVGTGCGAPTFGDFDHLSQIESNGFGWPRTLTSPLGDITVTGPAERILTLSAGLDEIVYELLQGDTTRMVGVSSATHQYSNIGEFVMDLPAVSKDAEQVVSLQPDIVIVDSFTDTQFAEQLASLGITVFQTAMEQSNYNLDGVLTLGYLLGLEDSADLLAETVNQRLSALQIQLPDTEQRGLIVSKYAQIWASGTGSTGDTILSALRIENSAAEVPADNGFITIEAIARFKPDVIFINGGGQAFRTELLSSAVLTEVPAQQNGQIYLINDRYASVLSHWNLCSVEELARLLYPTVFQDLVVCSPFSGS